MSFEIRPLDITQFKGDAIVNSLGVGEGITVYGQICKNVIKAAGSTKLKTLIKKEEPNAEPCHLFVTDGFDLPAKKIINICTPHFKYDKQMFALEHAYKLALVTAYKNKWYKVAFPIMGAGANRYPHSYVLSMAVKMMNAFSKLHKQMEITLCVPVVNEEDYNHKFDEKAIDKEIEKFFSENNDLSSRDFEYGKDSFKNLENYFDPSASEYTDMELVEGSERNYQSEWRYKEEKRERNRKRIAETDFSYGGDFVDLKEALLDFGVRPVKVDMKGLCQKSVAFYIETYIHNRYSQESDRKLIKKHVNTFLSGSNDSTSLKTKHGYETKRTTISVPVLMRYILALHMNKEEADDLLRFCGRVFSPVSEEDKCYEGLIKANKYVNNEDDTYKINGFCLKKAITQIFDYHDKKEAIPVNWNIN